MIGVKNNKDLFYVSHLGALKKDIADIRKFYISDVRGQGLSDYIKYYAEKDEMASTMRTYLIRFKEDDELAGYFSLKAGLISVNETKTDNGIVFDTMPGVELANFAINSAFIKKHPNFKGFGELFFGDYIIPTIKEVSEQIGVKVVYIYALPYESLLNRYRAYGFVRLSKETETALHIRLKPLYDYDCIFMCLILQ